MNFGADFVPCIRLGVLSSPGFKLGVLEPPPRSSVPGKEVYIFMVDAVPIGLQDLKYILFWRGGGGEGNAYKFSNNLWRIFHSMHKVEGFQPPSFQVGGGLSPHSSPAPTSLSPSHTPSFSAIRPAVPDIRKRGADVRTCSCVLP